MTLDIAVVFVLIVLTALLFSAELVPNEIVALGLLVLLVMLGPWTQIDTADALSGFSNPATVTVLAMFILSEGVRQTGAVHLLAKHLGRFTGTSERRHLLATVGIAGPLAGFVNNTPLVAVLIPTVVDLAKKHRISPSKLLIPLSFGAMLGGMLTLVGTSSNILAGDLSRQLIDRPIGIFEWTPLGVIVLITGSIYLLTVGRRLIPERIHPEQDLTAKFRMRKYLSRVRVGRTSALVNKRIDEGLETFGDHIDLDILQIIRGRRVYLGPYTDQTIEPGDVLTVRADQTTLRSFVERMQLTPLPAEKLSDEKFIDEQHTLLECTIPSDSTLVGESVISASFRQAYQGTVLAIRRGDQVIRDQLEVEPMREGDSLLIQTTRENEALLDKENDLVLTRATPAAAGLDTDAAETSAYRMAKLPLALGIFAGVIGAAALGIYPIAITALGGVVLMVITGCLKTDEAYRAVSWDIIFLLAGVIPLGMAIQETGAAAYMAGELTGAARGFPPVVVVGLFYLLTAVLANLITSSATVILMIPVAVDSALQMGLNPFAFLLTVAFAASTAFMTPIGYQTNLMIYTPGGYRFSDFFRVGAPLQLLLAVVTTLGIAVFWGLS